MRVYVDSSALVKRALREPESEFITAELERLAIAGTPFFSSTIAWVESSRAIRKRRDGVAPGAIADLVEVALSGVSEFTVSETVVSLARRIGPLTLRSLDAIHLATATLIDADLVIAYDERLLLAAEELGFATASPGGS